MVLSQDSALHLFLNRLKSRSIVTPDEEIAILRLPGCLAQIDARRDFINVGDDVDHACLIVDGLVGRFSQDRQGSRQIIGLQIPGDITNLQSLAGSKAIWGLTTLSPTTIVRFSHANLRQIASQYFGIAEAFWRDFVADAAIASQWVVNVGRKNATARVAHLFCEMAVRSELAGQGDRFAFPFPITQSDLADATGLTTVHINRTLRDLRTQSVVTARSKTVTIHDWPQLVSISGFNDAFLLLDGPYPRIAASAH